MARSACVGALALTLALAGATARAEDVKEDPEALRTRVKALEEKQRDLERRLEDAGKGPKQEPLAASKQEPATAPKAEAGGGGAPAGVTIDPKAQEGTIKLSLPFVRKLTVGGKLRIREEFRAPKDYRLPGTFGRPATDFSTSKGTVFTLLRTRLNFDFDISDPLRAFIEISDSRLFGDEDANGGVEPDIATVNLYQAFLELRLKSLVDLPISVRAGRFEVMPLGDQRLVSSLDWHNVGRSWDGAQVVLDTEGFWATLFATNVREGQTFAQLADGLKDFYFTGLYASFRGVAKHELDAYVLARFLDDRKFFRDERNRQGRRRDVTPGARVKGAVAGLDYTGEIMFQFGRQAHDDIRAWAAAATLGYTLELDKEMKFRVGGEYAFASGDKDPTDGRVGTFDQLLSFLHAYHGHMDLMAFQNMHGAKVDLTFTLDKDMSFHVDGHSFWLDRTKDGWYGANKARIRRSLTANVRGKTHVGFEVDNYVKARVLERLWIWAGYSHFFPGSYPRNTGFSRDMDWVFAQVEAKF